MTPLNWVLIVTSMLSAALCTTAKNKIAKKNLQTRSDSLLFNLLTNVFTMLVMLVNARSFSLHRITFLLALIFGAASMMSGFLNMVSFRYGPMSLTSLISSGGSLIISVVLGTILFKESVFPVQIAGGILMLAAIVLLSNLKNDRNIQPQWLPCVLSAAAFGGSLGIIQKYQGATGLSEEKPVFLLYTFMVCTLLSAVWFFAHKKAGSGEPVTFSVKKVLPAAAIVGITCAVSNIVNLKLAIEVPSVVFFPIYSGGLIMTNALVSSFWFKEKLSARQKIAFVIGFVAVFMLANVF
ncbi:MAG: hypothetical protein MJ063_00255 [Lachnospiraceae bacterium]|nr:hypothetical protein [Lachnospiraceae bacterium]